MRIFIYIIISAACLISCSEECQNKLKNEFELKAYFKERVTKTEISKIDTTHKVVQEYIVGYNFDSLEVISANSIYIEYNIERKIVKKYSCSRDNCCKNPVISVYQYQNGKLDNIKKINSSLKDTILYQKYIYDSKNRLSMKFIFPVDTINLFYNKADTLPYKQNYVSWTTNTNNEHVRLFRVTNFMYDSLGLKVRETWIDKDGLAMTTQFVYDSKNRLIIEMDSSLNEYNDSKTYILFWKKYKYDNRNRIIEEIKLGGTSMEPYPHFMFKIIYQFNSI